MQEMESGVSVHGQNSEARYSSGWLRRLRPNWADLGAAAKAVNLLKFSSIFIARTQFMNQWFGCARVSRHDQCHWEG